MNKFYFDGELIPVYSSQDLRAFLACEFSVDLDIEDLFGRLPRANRSDIQDLLIDRGNQFEQQYLDGLTSKSSSGNLDVINLADCSGLQDTFQKTLEAMRHGYDLIFQGCLVSLPWHGYPDCIQKIPGTPPYHTH